MLLLCSVYFCFLFSVVTFSEFQFQLHFNRTLKVGFDSLQFTPYTAMHRLCVVGGILFVQVNCQK